MRLAGIGGYISDLVNTGSERSARAKRHIIYSFGLKGISIMISLILVPLLLDYLDKERYGIWLTLTSVLGWFRFFDIGLGNGLRNKFTEAIAKNDHELARIYVSTTYAIITAIFATVLVCFYIVNPLLDWAVILNTNIVSRQELSILALVVFTFFILRFIFRLIGVILLADQRPAENNALEPAGNVVILLLILILIKTTRGGSLVLLGSILSIVPVIVLIVVTVILFRRRYRKYRPSFQHVRLRYSKELLSLGSKFFIISVSFIIFYSTSNIIITQVLGPDEVAVYNIAFKYFSVPIMAYAIIMSPIWSAVTDAYTKNDNLWLRNVLRKLNFVSIAFAAGIFIMVLFSTPVYRLWIGDRISVPLLLTVSMSFYALINVTISPYSQYLNGFGKIKLNSIIVLVQSIIFIPLAVFLTKTSLGVAGPIIATCLINVIGMITQPLQTYKILNHRAEGIWDK